MNLKFSREIKGKPTYFVEKIINSLDNECLERLVAANIQNGAYQSKDYRNVPNNFPPKIHTIRADRKNKWKVGCDIHFVISDKAKTQFQFAPVLKVKSIQKIFIHIDKGLSSGLYRFVKIDNRQLSDEGIKSLAINDGFENLDDFWSWFDEDFDGKIIHWTDYLYT